MVHWLMKLGEVSENLKFKHRNEQHYLQVCSVYRVVLDSNTEGNGQIDRYVQRYAGTYILDVSRLEEKEGFTTPTNEFKDPFFLLKLNK